ncbi:MAG: VWFA-related Acidobacterial domain protein, partial [Acidobacteria bacterium]|nr:VWFA-related Acidobacterial domain protein [Acidobacteriota bacterium]
AATSVTVAWTPRAPAGRLAAARTVSLSVKGAGGDRSFDAAVDAGAITFPSPTGALQLSLTVRDAAGNILDEDRRPFTVPDLSAPALTIPPPVLLRTRTVAEARTIAGGGRATPFAGREFHRTERVFVRFSVSGAAESEAAVSARLTNHTGATLLALPVVRLAAGYQVEVPLTSIARGDYIVAVAAAHDEERTHALVPLRVLPF